MARALVMSLAVLGMLSMADQFVTTTTCTGLAPADWTYQTMSGTTGGAATENRWLQMGNAITMGSAVISTDLTAVSSGYANAGVQIDGATAVGLLIVTTPSLANIGAVGWNLDMAANNVISKIWEDKLSDAIGAQTAFDNTAGHLSVGNKMTDMCTIEGGTMFFGLNENFGEATGTANTRTADLIAKYDPYVSPFVTTSNVHNTYFSIFGGTAAAAGPGGFYTGEATSASHALYFSANNKLLTGGMTLQTPSDSSPSFMLPMGLLQLGTSTVKRFVTCVNGGANAWGTKYVAVVTTDALIMVKHDTMVSNYGRATLYSNDGAVATGAAAVQGFSAAGHMLAQAAFITNLHQLCESSAGYAVGNIGNVQAVAYQTTDGDACTNELANLLNGGSISADAQFAFGSLRGFVYGPRISLDGGTTSAEQWAFLGDGGSTGSIYQFNYLTGSWSVAFAGPATAVTVITPGFSGTGSYSGAFGLARWRNFLYFMNYVPVAVGTAGVDGTAAAAAHLNHYLYVCDVDMKVIARVSGPLAHDYRVYGVSATANPSGSHSITSVPMSEFSLQDITGGTYQSISQYVTKTAGKASYTAVADTVYTNVISRVWFSNLCPAVEGFILLRTSHEGHWIIIPKFGMVYQWAGATRGDGLSWQPAQGTVMSLTTTATGFTATTTYASAFTAGAEKYQLISALDHVNTGTTLISNGKAVLDATAISENNHPAQVWAGAIGSYTSNGFALMQPFVFYNLKISATHTGWASVATSAGSYNLLTQINFGLVIPMHMSQTVAANCMTIGHSQVSVGAAAENTYFTAGDAAATNYAVSGLAPLWVGGGLSLPCGAVAGATTKTATYMVTKTMTMEIADDSTTSSTSSSTTTSTSSSTTSSTTTGSNTSGSSSSGAATMAVASAIAVFVACMMF